MAEPLPGVHGGMNLLNQMEGTAVSMSEETIKAMSDVIHRSAGGISGGGLPGQKTPEVAGTLDALSGNRTMPVGRSMFPMPPTNPPATSFPTAGQSELDLISAVRVKLTRVASEFGIPYAEVRDFFVSKL